MKIVLIVLLLSSVSLSGISRNDSLEGKIPADSIRILRRHKLKAALLAFPLIGITGAHRVFMGTEPYMPVIYLATVGGFGILPLIDFVVILATPARKLKQFEPSEKVFFWAQ